MSAIVLIAVAFFIHARGGSPALKLALAVALMLRTIAAVFHRFVATLPEGGADAIGFERTAWQWAQSGCGNLGQYLNLAGSHVHSWVIGNIYACTVRAPFLFQMINVALGVATVYLVARIATELWDRQAGVRAAWVAALYPVFIIYSAVPIREVWFTFFFLLGIFCLVRWIKTWRTAYLLSAGVLMLPATVIHGMAIFSLAAIGFVIMIWGSKELFRGSIVVRKGLLVGSLMFFSALGIGAPFLLDARFSSIGQVGKLMEQADTLDERAAAARGGSAFPSYLVPANDLQMVALTPIRMIYVLFGPPVWHIRAPIHAIGTIDGLFYLALALLMMRYREVWWAKREFRILIGVVIVLTVILSWGSSNFGTALRHRAKFLGVLIALAAGLLGRKRWRNARLAKLGGGSGKKPLVQKGDPPTLLGRPSWFDSSGSSMMTPKRRID